MTRKLGLVVMAFGLVSLVMGAVFVQQAFAKEAYLVETMNQEQVTALDGSGEIVNSSKLAEDTAAVIKEHRRTIAPTYEDLLGGGMFDPTVPEHLLYGMAMNMENSLYLSVTAFGVFTAIKGIGVFMIVMGIALGVTGYAIRKNAA